MQTNWQKVYIGNDYQVNCAECVPKFKFILSIIFKQYMRLYW